MGGSYYSFPCSILSIGKDHKNPQKISLCSNNIKENLSEKHGLVSRTYYKNGKLRHKNADESWEIIENLAFYDHEGWNDSKNFVKPVKAISIPQSTSKTPDRRLLELEDQINFLLKGSRPKPKPSSTHVPQAYAEDKNKPIKRDKKEKGVEAPNSQPVEYYLKHRINEKLIEGLIDNQRFNDSLSGYRVEKMKGKAYTLSPRGPVYEAILKKNITRKDDIGGNFEIPWNIGGLKCISTLVDQGSDVNVMPLSTYMKLTDERPTEIYIRLSLASHSYIYPLGIGEDVLVDVVDFVYPVDFMILDIKEYEKRPFILGTSFLTIPKAVIKFDKVTITLRSGKSKISFQRKPESIRKVKKWIMNIIRPIAPTMTVNRLVLE
nr:hypothetical protein [Tanacetum cinerariifolium]